MSQRHDPAVGGATATSGAATPTRRSNGSSAIGAPVGPGSILWRIAGDGRGLLPGTAAGIMQLMLPGLGAGVADHSDFFRDPWGRILRSIPQIWATIFSVDEVGDERGRAIRDLHPHIKGTDQQGRSYHALDPDVFWWAHATFTWEFFRAADLYYALPLRRREKEQLYAESVTWYRRYGVSDRPVPVDLAAFEARFEEICRHELELTPAVARVLSPPDEARELPDVLPASLAFAESAVKRARTDNLRLMTFGAMPDTVRRRFDIPWSNRDRAQFLALCMAIRGVGGVLDPSRFDFLFPPGTPHRGDA